MEMRCHDTKKSKIQTGSIGEHEELDGEDRTESLLPVMMKMTNRREVADELGDLSIALLSASCTAGSVKSASVGFLFVSGVNESNGFYWDKSTGWSRPLDDPIQETQGTPLRRL